MTGLMNATYIYYITIITSMDLNTIPLVINVAMKKEDFLTTVDMW